jgi:hypothetical protein
MSLQNISYLMSYVNLELIFLWIRNEYSRLKIPICNCLNFGNETLTARNGGTKWLHQNIFSAWFSNSMGSIHSWNKFSRKVLHFLKYSNFEIKLSSTTCGRFMKFWRWFPIICGQFTVGIIVWFLAPRLSLTEINGGLNSW